MTLAGLPGSQVSNDGDIMRILADHDRRLRELAAQDVLATAGISTQPNGITVTGTENVTGTLNVSGNSTFGGNMVVNGNLSVPNGSISNDALSNPISPLATHVGTNNISLATGANVEKLRATITVPSGYTQALVFATATMVAINSSAATGSAYLGVKINGTAPGAASQSTAVAGWPVCVPATGTILLTSLSGTFIVTATASSDNNPWAANVNNFINLDVMTVFLR